MKIFWRFFRYVKKYMKSLIAANVSMLLFVVFNLLSFTILMPFTDILFNQIPPDLKKPEALTFSTFKENLNYQLSMLIKDIDKLDLILYFCVIIIVIFGLKNIFSYLQTYFMSNCDQGIIKDIRHDLYKHIQNMSMSFFTEEKKGVLISRIINDIQVIRDSIIFIINSLFRDPAVIISFTLTLFLINWKLTLIIYLMFPVAGFLLSRLGNSLKKKTIKSQEKIGDITSILEETFGAIRVVKAFNMEDYEIQKFRKEEEKYFDTLKSLARRRALASPITETLGVFAVTAIIYFIGKDILLGKSDMTAGALATYLIVFFQMMPSLKLFAQSFNSIKEGMAAAERVFSILDIKPQITDKPDAIEIKSFEKEIEFRDVTFKYEKSDIILNGINLKINKGDILAIVGFSGAGKSTLIDLIPRFYDVTSGAILIDGIDIRDIKTSSLRSLMGIVTQETMLFNDTVKNNIAYGLSDIKMESVIEAAKAANAHDFISELSEGYDTFIGDRGVKLSGGERQRISIARALLKNPPILILDEATSALDRHSEILVQQAIERLMIGRTSIVIAHRLSTIQNAGRIIVLDKGKIVETGSHLELLNQNGLYSRLYNMQFQN